MKNVLLALKGYKIGFKVIKGDTQTQLIPVNDEKKAVAIFKQYYRLLIEANK